MHPSPIPDDEVWEGATRKVIGPPRGDLELADPVEALVEVREGYGPMIHLRMVLDPEDVQRIARGERMFWLTWYSDHLHPFNAQLPVLSPLDRWKVGLPNACRFCSVHVVPADRGDLAADTWRHVDIDIRECQHPYPVDLLEPSG